LSMTPYHSRISKNFIFFLDALFGHRVEDICNT
jgi:hypothetical protein